jgi:hypothetical protein
MRESKFQRAIQTVIANARLEDSKSTHNSSQQLKGEAEHGDTVWVDAIERLEQSYDNLAP